MSVDVARQVSSILNNSVCWQTPLLGTGAWCWRVVVVRQAGILSCRVSCAGMIGSPARLKAIVDTQKSLTGISRYLCCR